MNMLWNYKQLIQITTITITSNTYDRSSSQ
jgi:hypothetical protein